MDDDADVLAIKKGLAYVFKDDLLQRLPLKKEIGHETDTYSHSKPPHQPIFWLPPAGSQTTEEYVPGCLQKRISPPSPSKLPYEAPLFSFVKRRNELLGVIDYRVLIRITQLNIASILQTS